MATPHCFVCGRWDGTHSGGCERTGHDYRQQADLLDALRAGRAIPERPVVLIINVGDKQYVTHPWNNNDRHYGPASLEVTVMHDGTIKWQDR